MLREESPKTTGMCWDIYEDSGGIAIQTYIMNYLAYNNGCYIDQVIERVTPKLMIKHALDLVHNPYTNIVDALQAIYCVYIILQNRYPDDIFPEYWI